MSRMTKISGVVVCAAASLGVLAALAQTADGVPTELYVRTVPSGAAITVDGKEQGVSPNLFQVEPGEHTVVVRLAGQQPKTEIITVRDGRIKRVVLRFEDGAGTGDSATAVVEAVDAETLLERLLNPPQGWKVISSERVSTSQRIAIAKRLTGRITKLWNTVLSGHGERVQVNLMDCPTKEDAEKVHRIVCSMKGDRAYCPRIGNVIVEFVGTFDAAFAERATQELGLARVTPDAAAEAAAKRFLVATVARDVAQMQKLIVEMPPRWTAEKMPEFVREIRDEVFADIPQKLTEIRETVVKDDWAAVRIDGPKSSKGKFLWLALRQTPNGWRVCHADDARPGDTLVEHFEDFVSRQGTDRPVTTTKVDASVVAPNASSNMIRTLEQRGWRLGRDEQGRIVAAIWSGRASSDGATASSGDDTATEVETATDRNQERSSQVDDLLARDLALMAQLPHLKSLVMQFARMCPVAYQQLSRLRGLEDLNLYGANTDDTALASIGKLHDLRELALSRTKVTDEGLKHLAGLKNLQWLSVYGTAVSDAGLVHLKDLSKLENLYLGETRVTDAGLEHLRPLESLKLLYLHDNSITDAGLRTLAELKDLETLSLIDTQITDAGLQHLIPLEKLTSLSLRGSKVTTGGLERFHAARPYCCKTDVKLFSPEQKSSADGASTGDSASADGGDSRP